MMGEAEGGDGGAGGVGQAVSQTCPNRRLKRSGVRRKLTHQTPCSAQILSLVLFWRLLGERETTWPARQESSRRTDIDSDCSDLTWCTWGRPTYRRPCRRLQSP